MFALHIEGSSFKKPLSAAKEKECFERLAAGDEQARSLLIEHNLRLVAHIAKSTTRLQTIRMISFRSVQLD